jgi:hypothetical protein
MLGVKHAQMQRLRKQVGQAFERKSEKPGQPGYVYAPAWLRAWARLDAPAADRGKELDDDALFKRARREKMELELAEAKRDLIHINEVRNIFDVAAATIHQALDATTDRAFAELVSDRLARAEKELNEKLNGHRRNGAR